MWYLAGAMNYAHASSFAAADPFQDASGKLQVLSVGQMAPADAALLADRRKDIATAAQFYGYAASSGTWIQNQVTCPYTPRYMILHELHLSQNGSISLFTALVPRQPGKVRIIPVFHHGIQALRVFGSTVGTRTLIDGVISAPKLSEDTHQDDDWTTLAYCYGALAGAEPVGARARLPDETAPRLEVGQNGSFRDISFSVIGPGHFLQDWTIQYDGRGKVQSIRLSTGGHHPPREIPGEQSPRIRKVPGVAPVAENLIPDPK